MMVKVAFGYMAFSRWASPLPTGPKVSIMESPTSETVIARFLAVRVSTGVGDGVGVTFTVGRGVGVDVASGTGDTTDVSGMNPKRSPKLTCGFVVATVSVMTGVGSGSGDIILSAAYAVAVNRREKAITNTAIQRISCIIQNILETCYNPSSYEKSIYTRGAGTHS